MSFLVKIDESTVARDTDILLKIRRIEGVEFASIISEEDVPMVENLKNERDDFEFILKEVGEMLWRLEKGDERIEEVRRRIELEIGADFKGIPQNSGPDRFCRGLK